jgi:hypothetical protein
VISAHSSCLTAISRAQHPSVPVAHSDNGGRNAGSRSRGCSLGMSASTTGRTLRSRPECLHSHNHNAEAAVAVHYRFQTRHNPLRRALLPPCADLAQACALDTHEAQWDIRCGHLLPSEDHKCTRNRRYCSRTRDRLHRKSDDGSKGSLAFSV